MNLDKYSIAGYLMVRKPTHDYDPNYVTSLPLNPVRGIHYHGMQRMEWYDVDTYFLEKRLPEKFMAKYEEIIQSEYFNLFVDLATTKEDVFLFMNLDEEIPIKNEVIVLSSPTLNAIYSEVLVSEDLVEWLGYDIWTLGGWSLIRHAIFENRQLCLLENNPINEFGLFDTSESMVQFVQEYNALGSSDKVDPLIDGMPVEAIRVGRLTIQS
ncbi:hypothetical protein [Xanthocytophaga flava]|uniref:hypothetical protein n=1 Tax=Xanthocytophaga flava TaxID=3048013 RepID=UPI0028D3A027|nr:hypothetical protein [Xanthocytophaga flavus]MDJ1470406.1 hypothetical protein [Xanthocytophaga flavus]